MPEINRGFQSQLSRNVLITNHSFIQIAPLWLVFSSNLSLMVILFEKCLLKVMVEHLAESENEHLPPGYPLQGAGL